MAMEDVLALLAVCHFARKSGVDIAIALLAPGNGKYGHVERADLEQCPTLNGGKSGPIGGQAPTVFPSPAEDDGADTVWDKESEQYLFFPGGSSTCSVWLCGGQPRVEGWSLWANRPTCNQQADI